MVEVTGVSWLINHLTQVFFFLAFGWVAFTIYRQQQHQNKNKHQKLKKVSASKGNEPLSLHPEVDLARCIGCGSCAGACPEGRILQIINHKAVLVAGSQCVGHGECEVACPMGAIKLVFGTKTKGMDLPRLTTDYETNIPGLYIAGELGGMGLIRNAVKQGALAATHALKNLTKEKAEVDLLVVGAGPAGFSAVLTAIAQQKSYICIEQNKFGGTISNFPRQKLVMSHPFTLPLVGLVKFAASTVNKEELLALWKKIQTKTGLQVREGVKFVSLKKENSIFRVQTSHREITARKVILATGVRGSPRKLDVPGEEKSKVTYNMVDADQYQDKHLAVVGGGNAAIEVSALLAKPQLKNQVHLLVRGSQLERCNAENRAKIEELQSQGLVEIWYQSSISAIEDQELSVLREGQEVRLKNDFTFIMIGAEMPQRFLMELGIKIERKFGEGLGASA